MIRALTPTQKRNLWLGLLAGPVAWVIYFTAGYLFLEAVCRQVSPITRFLGLPWPSLVIVLLTLITLAVIGYAGRRTWPWLQPDNRPEYSHFMAQCGLFLGGLFAFITFLTGIPALALPPCTFVP